MAFLEWQIESFDNFDLILKKRCGEMINRLNAMSLESAREALGDPRGLHSSLYFKLTPPLHEEVAGNYRGSDFDVLRNSVVFFAFGPNDGTTEIARPNQVAQMMLHYKQALRHHRFRRLNSVEETLRSFIPLTIAFGAIHPFLDGNGHIQRLTFQHMVERVGYRMKPIWTVHPCPYGEVVHRALAARDITPVVNHLMRFVDASPLSTRF